jgi:endonuclease
MNFHDFILIAEEAAKAGRSVVFGCRCEVWYSGKAESYLAEGDRIVLVKQDGNILVHQPDGTNPVNYMKEGTTFTITPHDDHVFLNAQNLALHDYLDIRIERVYFINSVALVDGQSIQVKGTEEDMAQMLYENPGIIEPGFTPVSREEQTKYGFVDLLGFDKNRVLTIVECKRYNADLAAVTQLRRYVEKMKESKGISNIRGILASPAISSNAKKMLEAWGFTHVNAQPPNYMERFDKHQKSLTQFD